MSRTISQDAFDAVVRENMEEFEMEAEPAAHDAVAQFKSQGVDVSMLDVSGRQDMLGTRQQVRKLVEQLKTWENQIATEAAQAQEGLRTLAQYLGREGDEGRNCQTAAGEAGGIAAITAYVVPTAPPELLLAALETAQLACRGHVRNRDLFNLQDMGALCGFLGGKPGPEGMVAALGLVRVVCRQNETNKSAFMRSGGAAILTAALQDHAEDAAVVTEACGALRAVTMGDDMRKDFSGTYDHVKTFVGRGLIPTLVQAATRFMDRGPTLAAVLQALKQLAANDEAVKMIVSFGGLEVLSQALQAHPSSVKVCRAAVSVLRNVSGNDELKTQIATGPALGLLMAAAAQHPADAPLQEHALAALAAMSLRSPDNSRRLVTAGALPLVMAAMTAHPDFAALQRQAALALRNISARCPDLREQILDEGAENLLRAAGRHQGCVDEAYAALRDLRCEVSMVTVAADGSVQQAVEQFGSKPANFNPSLQESRDMDGRVSGAATAPAQGGYRL